MSMKIDKESQKSANLYETLCNSGVKRLTRELEVFHFTSINSHQRLQSPRNVSLFRIRRQ